MIPIPSETTKKFFIRHSLFTAGYIAMNSAAITGAFDGLKPPGTWVFSMVAAAPIIGDIWAVLVWMRDSDEFVRMLAAKRFIVATGATLAIATVWGFMELYAKTPHVSAAMVYPLWAVAFGVVSLFIRTSH